MTGQRLHADVSSGGAGSLPVKPGAMVRGIGGAAEVAPATLPVPQELPMRDSLEHHPHGSKRSGERRRAAEAQRRDVIHDQAPVPEVRSTEGEVK
jgi:hypothetical protein